MPERGTVKFYLHERDYGFAVPDLGGTDIYLHRKQIVGGAALKSGTRIEYDTVHDSTKGKFWARNIKVVS